MMSLVMEMETFRLLTANRYQVRTSTGYAIKRGIVEFIYMHTELLVTKPYIISKEENTCDLFLQC